MRATRSALGAALLLAALGSRASAQVSQPDTAGFDHPSHAKVFPSCLTCHPGAGTTGQRLFPNPEACANCHDGTVEPRVAWRPRVGPRATNLTFEHGEHRTDVQRAADRQAGREAPVCVSCHIPDGAGWMTVQRAVQPRCFDCHGLRTTHLAAPDTSCATCHLPLAQARTLTDSVIRAFEKPPSHGVVGFIGSGQASHGQLAQPDGSGRFAIASSCATCHARDFCLNCHVDAPERPTIQALAPDPRSLLIPAKLEAPSSHRRADFQQKHRALAGRKGATCATCHTRESCAACHAAGLPGSAASLAAAGPGRAVGAETVRRLPQSHVGDFSERHAPQATATPTACASCHVRAMCLDCHRPDPGSGSGFHPGAFLASHPSAAYARQSSCADCHNQAQFCATCHAQAGLGARGQLALGGRFHDAKQSFVLGHGQAARQSLESCVSCHVERDCLTCHSAVGGRRFNPHGPGFDPERLRRRNPELCSACHGLAIPGT